MQTKKIILTLCLAAISLTGQAQLKGGVKAGLNIASLKGTYPYGVNNKQKLGFHFGVTAEYPLENPKFSVVGEMLFSTQGNITDQSRQINSSGTYSYEDQRQTLSLTNINVPIMFRYYVFEKLSIEGGPQFGLVLKGQQKTEVTNTSNPAQNVTYTEDVLKGGSYELRGAVRPTYKSIEPFDAGLNLGVTYNFNEAIFLQVHYYFGLTDVNSFPKDYLTRNENDFKSSVFQISLGCNFF